MVRLPPLSGQVPAVVPLLRHQVLAPVLVSSLVKKSRPLAAIRFWITEPVAPGTRSLTRKAGPGLAVGVLPGGGSVGVMMGAVAVPGGQVGWRVEVGTSPGSVQGGIDEGVAVMARTRGTPRPLLRCPAVSS